MSLLNYSRTLIAGTPENVNDVQDMFNDVRTLVNGNLDATNLASGVKPADLMAPYEVVATAPFSINGAQAAGTYFPFFNGSFQSAVTQGPGPIPLVPVDGAAYAIAGLTAKMRVRVAWVTNAVAPTGTYTFGLYPLTIAGTAANITVTAGAAVTGSTVARATPAASGRFIDASADFTIPATSVYSLGMVIPTVAASSAIIGNMFLEVHHV